MRTSSRLAKIGVVCAAVTVVCAAVVAVDVAAHRALSLSSDFNIRGYRGPLIGTRQPAELRIAVLGESTTFGYGVRWHEAMPAQLEAVLRARRPGGPPVRVVNLGYNGEGAYSYPFTLRDYADLAPDLVVFYSGYNDLRPGNRRVFRHESPVFVATGYLPMLPVLVRAKFDAWRGVDDEDDEGAPEAGGSPAVRFGPGGAQGLEALQAEDGAADHASAWADYCASMHEAVGQAVAQGAAVVVVTQPDLGPRHRAQQRALRHALDSTFAGRDVRLVDLSGTVDLEDRSLAWDGMHLTAEGNRRIAHALAAAVEPVIAARAGLARVR